MSPKGASVVIESMTMRIFEIISLKNRLATEEKQLISRIRELEAIGSIENEPDNDTTCVDMGW